MRGFLLILIISACKRHIESDDSSSDSSSDSGAGKLSVSDSRDSDDSSSNSSDSGFFDQSSDNKSPISKKIQRIKENTRSKHEQKYAKKKKSNKKKKKNSKKNTKKQKKNNKKRGQNYNGNMDVSEVMFTSNKSNSKKLIQEDSDLFMNDLIEILAERKKSKLR